MGKRDRLGFMSLAITFGLAALFLSAGLANAQQPKISAEIIDRAQANQTVRVIVRLNVAAQVEGTLPDGQAVTAQRQSIVAAQNALLADLAGRRYRVTGRVNTIPVLGLEVGLDALAVLERSPRVRSVVEDRLAKPLLYDSVPLIQADQAWAFGFDGTGWAVAILDTGVNGSHPFLTNAVVAEACFASNNSCPDGSNQQIGTGAGVPCTYAPDGCSHGTHVGGIAAGRGTNFSGVARGANLVAVQVFSRTTGPACTGGEDPCPTSYTMDQILALNHVYSLRNTHQIAAVNMSLGGGTFTDQEACDADAAASGIKMAIDNLRQARIATVIAAGNDGLANAISTPGCISTAVSVGSTTKTDDISTFSNSASFLSLVAPGGDGGTGSGNICSSVPDFSTWTTCSDAGTGGKFGFASGTSMAAPHVAGAWAILKQGAD